MPYPKFHNPDGDTAVASRFRGTRDAIGAQSAFLDKQSLKLPDCPVCGYGTPKRSIVYHHLYECADCGIRLERSFEHGKKFEPVLFGGGNSFSVRQGKLVGCDDLSPTQRQLLTLFALAWANKKTICVSKIAAIYFETSGEIGKHFGAKTARTIGSWCKKELRQIVKAGYISSLDLCQTIAKNFQLIPEAPK